MSYTAHEIWALNICINLDMFVSKINHMLWASELYIGLTVYYSLADSADNKLIYFPENRLIFHANCLQRRNIGKNYGKCPKILNTKVCNKMPYADSADPDQTAPEGVIWSGSSLFAIPLSILRDKCI